MQTHYLYCLLLWQNVKESFTSIGSLINSRSEIIFHVVDTALVIPYNLGSSVLLLLVNLIGKSVDLFHEQEALLDHVIRKDDLYEALDVGILVVYV